MYDRVLQRIIKEEIDNFSKKLPKQQLNELFSIKANDIYKNIDKLDFTAENFDTEFFSWFFSTIVDAINEHQQDWIENLKEQKLRTLCYKYFTKVEFIDIDKLEEHIKVEVKPYMSALQNYVSLETFTNKFFNLPFQLLINLMRYLFVNFKELKEQVKVSKTEVKDKILEYKDERFQFVKKLDQISKKYQNNFDFEKCKELFDVGLFFEINEVNMGVVEYVSKVINDKDALKSMKEYFTNSFILHIKTVVENGPCYAELMETIKKGEREEYFSATGFQVGNRFTLAIEKEEHDSIAQVEKESRKKEVE